VSYAIEAFDLGKRFRDFWAVKSLSMKFRRSELGVLAGPNGAGKTTTVRMLTTYFKPSKGWARVAGYDTVKECKEVRRRVSYLPQGVGLYGDITPEEYVVQNLMLRGISYWDAKKEAKTWIELLGLWDVRKRRAYVLSGGEKRRALVAAALSVPAEVYILDEPTTGIDVEGRYTVLKALRRAAASGSTVLVTTHNLYEAQIAADSVVVIDRGQVVAEGHPQKLVDSFRWRFKAVIDKPGRPLTGVDHIDLGDKVVVYGASRGEVLRLVEELGVGVHAVKEVDLEDVYLYMVRSR